MAYLEDIEINVWRIKEDNDLLEEFWEDEDPEHLEQLLTHSFKSHPNHSNIRRVTKTLSQVSDIEMYGFRRLPLFLSQYLDRGAQDNKFKPILDKTDSRNEETGEMEVARIGSLEDFDEQMQ
ncbi:hypothetical protein LTS18_013243 [Coniosporium uncinatum]|uniref:Uncharacterized protein n=1 Tax=Coniosporium uncinatum TaxID=93489 RepID=A0ACC3CWK3_9PEZI|nr:hypothetical protein LTS18_013243 [Coniosporium uncinatum]